MLLTAVLQADVCAHPQGRRSGGLLQPSGTASVRHRMDWSSRLDNYASDDAFGGSGFNAGGEWNFGVQMETRF